MENAWSWFNTRIQVQEITSIQDRLALKMNRCLQGALVPEWMTKGRQHQSRRRPSKEPPKNNYSPITCLLLANKLRVIHWRTDRMPQRIQRHSRVTVHRSTHQQREQKQSEKSRYGLKWLQKGILNCSAKLDYKLPQNVQNIKWIRELYWENHENLESEMDSRREKLSWSEGPKGYISRRCTITITIHNCHDAT